MANKRLTSPTEMLLYKSKLNKREQTMQNILNRITYYFLNRAYTQLEATGELQNADDAAEFLEDYFAQLVK
jgi:hypothetical protein